MDDINGILKAQEECCQLGLDIDNTSEAVKIWQGREISIKCDPPQPIQGDGEIWGETPVSARVLPGVLPVLVNRTSENR